MHMEVTSLKQAMQGLIPESSSIIEGCVISANPLKINLVNDPKMNLTKNSVVVPKEFTDYNMSISVPDEGSNITITVHNALKAGETVYLLNYNGGKKYFVLGRKE